jgi:hypothetical protein
MKILVLFNDIKILILFNDIKILILFNDTKNICVIEYNFDFIMYTIVYIL